MNRDDRTLQMYGCPHCKSSPEWVTNELGTDRKLRCPKCDCGPAKMTESRWWAAQHWNDWVDSEKAKIEARTLLADFEKERVAHSKAVQIKIETKVPSKWRFVDLETGDVWWWDERVSHGRPPGFKLATDLAFTRREGGP